MIALKYRRQANLSIDFGAVAALSAVTALSLSLVGLSQLTSIKTSIGDSGKSHPMLVSKFSGVLFGTMVTHSLATPGLPCLLVEDCTYAITRESGGLPFKEFYIPFNMLK